MNILFYFLAIVVVFALGFTALQNWRQKKSSVQNDKHHGFCPRIGFSRLDGMESLSLLLENGLHTHVWAEEIEIFLTELVANNQTADPTLRGTKKIRQMVRHGDTLPISLAEVIYKAAGEPQRKYSSVLFSKLRYRVGEEWFEKELEACRIQMLGLTLSDVRRERNPAQKLPIQEKPKEVATIETK
ncbi:MAG TPA: hypothetical protein VHT72_00360 [Puia sp.]|nr:hypothetical protein [Puia sp.]